MAFGSGRPWPEERRAQALALMAEKAACPCSRSHENASKCHSDSNIARALGVTASAFRHFRRQQDPAYVAQQRAANKKLRESMKATGDVLNTRYHKPKAPVDVLAERDRRYEEATQLSTTAILMGDPVPCRSALGASPSHPKTPSQGGAPL